MTSRQLFLVRGNPETNTKTFSSPNRKADESAVGDYTENPPSTPPSERREEEEEVGGRESRGPTNPLSKLKWLLLIVASVSTTNPLSKANALSSMDILSHY